MKLLHRIYLLRIVLILFFIFFFIYSEKNYGVQTIASAEVLTLEDEHRVSELIFRQIHHQLDSIVELSSKRYGFNGNIILAVDNELVYQRCSGYENFRARKMLTPESRFQLASVSKQFTAMAILILQEEGKLRLDDPIQQYIPELPYPGITIRHLLNHTSGIPNYMWYVENNWASDTLLPTNEDMIRILSEKATILNFTPGKRFVYSNTGYAVLASIVERISGQSFGNFVSEHIFRPLGMKNASVCTPSIRGTDPSYPVGYRRSWSRSNPYEIGIHDGIAGDKGVYASIQDLFKWDQALNGEKLVSRESIRQAFSPGRLDSKREIPYGFGFRLTREGNSYVVYHHGRWSGFRTAFVKYLPENITVIILSNNSFNGLTQLTSAFKDTWENASSCRTLEAIVHTVLSEGIEEGLSLYTDNYKAQNEWIADPVVFLKIADYLEGSGKKEKSKIMRDFYQQLSS